MPEWNEILQVIAIAAAPLSERGAIPIALTVYEMDPASAYIWSVLGNFLPVPFLLAGLGWFINFLSRWNWVKRAMHWWFDRTQRRKRALIERWGALGLVIFVAVPLPFTGPWSGALVAYLFGIPFKYALPLIGLGILIYGFLVLGVSLGVIHWFKL
ncbi:small multi-drug export protein [Candidatus Acetothermia bacterium]|nr:small multi-drug export protein [Candidatus Acetothermia bacterium]MBI3459848.1 small multi-drug export protein [Candidatus Acetothermia bacterium]